MVTANTLPYKAVSDMNSFLLGLRHGMLRDRFSESRCFRRHPNPESHIASA